MFCPSGSSHESSTITNTNAIRFDISDADIETGVIRIVMSSETLLCYAKFGDSAVVADSSGFVVRHGVEYIKIPSGVTHVSFIGTALSNNRAVYVTVGQKT